MFVLRGGRSDWFAFECVGVRGEERLGMEMRAKYEQAQEVAELDGLVGLMYLP